MPPPRNNTPVNPNLANPHQNLTPSTPASTPTPSVNLTLSTPPNNPEQIRTNLNKPEHRRTPRPDREPPRITPEHPEKTKP